MFSRLVILTLKVPSASVKPDSQASLRLGLTNTVLGIIVGHKP